MRDRRSRPTTFELLPGHRLVGWSRVICICLFIGAMGKSAQVPLHVWLPDSMEGPTPISALIHAATMVTAGIFMVARMSPLFELSETALSVRARDRRASTALFMGLLGIVQNDIKRVVAYSTLSQLGYMTVALGVSAYAGGDLPPDDPRVLQGAAVPGRGLGDHRACTTSRTCARWAGCSKYMPITFLDRLGRLAGAGRLPGASRVLLQGHDHRGRAPFEAAGRRLRLLSCVLIGVFVTALLHLPPGVPDLPRQASAWTSTPASTCTKVTVRCVTHARWCCWRSRRVIAGWPYDRADAVRRLLRAARSRSRPAHDVLAELGRGVPRRGGARPAAHDLHGFQRDAVLPGAGRRRAGLVPVPDASRHLPGGCAGAAQVRSIRCW
ncbi:MAG: hypothetical protein MZV65_33910 [Chromatiales bacterium]|nr:hypothetical protein [Chromatiales bacterium]